MSQDNNFSQGPVPQSARKGVLALTFVMLGLTFFSASMWTGGTLGTGLSYHDFFLAVLIGNLLLGIYTSFLGYIGAKTGLTTHLLARFSFGVKGSWLPSLLLGGTQVGWFGVGVAMFAIPVGKATGLDINLLIAVSGLLMTVTVSGVNLRTLEQEQQVKTRTAEQNARIAAFEAERRREAEQTRILAERQIQETEIEREQAVRSRKVEAEREVRIKEIEQQQVTEIANQTKSIAIAAKSEQQSQAEARANLALAEAVSAQQNVETTRQTAEADRAKQVALIAAAQDAETKAVELTVRAKAEKEAAEMQAAAIVELAEATRKKGLAEAEAQRALNDAINVLSDEQTSLKFKLALLQALPAVIEKSVEPMKSIDGIKIIQVDGLNRGSAAGDANTGNVGGGNLAEQALSAALSYRTQAPLIDSLLNEIGVSGGSLAALTSPLTSTTPVAENVE